MDSFADLLALPVEIRTQIYSYLLPFVGRDWWNGKLVWWQHNNEHDEYHHYKCAQSHSHGYHTVKSELTISVASYPKLPPPSCVPAIKSITRRPTICKAAAESAWRLKTLYAYWASHSNRRPKSCHVQVLSLMLVASTSGSSATSVLVLTFNKSVPYI
jgi:hypothetical protein